MYSNIVLPTILKKMSDLPFTLDQLNNDLEKFMRDKNITSSSSWSRLFDETIASLRFPFHNKLLTSIQKFLKLQYITNFHVA